MMSGLKKIGFFSALILPFLLITGFYLGGLGLWAVHIFVFVMVPGMDFILKTDKSNVPKNEISQRAKAYFYKFVTFAWVYVQLSVLVWACYIVATRELSWLQWLAFSSGTALVTGGIGITVAHELGHKAGKLEQFYAKVLLMMVCYMHFIVEHNRGHHVRVATPEDPATSRFGESFYAFWLRSVRDGYKSAWQLETQRLERAGIRFWSLGNQMLQSVWIPLFFVGTLTLGLSLLQGELVWEVPVFFFIQSILGFSLLEVVNYLEHYGMQRRKLESGFYERVTPLHSWNASHIVSNFLLFQLQRHSDHHAAAHKPYQILDHVEESPQLPAGYSAMILVALVPPLWFKIMDPRLKAWRAKTFA
ncbi:alkane 1-monooxygenase [Algoriphagus namhaensis]